VSVSKKSFTTFYTRLPASCWSRRCPNEVRTPWHTSRSWSPISSESSRTWSCPATHPSTTSTASATLSYRCPWFKPQLLRHSGKIRQTRELCSRWSSEFNIKPASNRLERECRNVCSYFCMQSNGLFLICSIPSQWCYKILTKLIASRLTVFLWQAHHITSEKYKLGLIPLLSVFKQCFRTTQFEKFTLPTVCVCSWCLHYKNITDFVVS